MEISSAIAGSLLEKMEGRVYNYVIRKKWNVERENPRVNDVVLVAEDNVPRHRWRLGIVVELLPGQDGFVRTVRVKTAAGSVIMGHGVEETLCSGQPEIFYASYGRDNLLISGTGYEGHRQ
ncbi:LOW QUALITY PROTEIN: hypothetical protein M514_21447 [Trichuris suis]|uniref:DUF5641 domain-containing protein n=1 Tax=Trichuris suis TaxID=68888 RepID=A0A085NAC1_9BILA|nr:LOW QUALITY PROTEIN: hypothetical protein M514_21447 [Trichuris suis]